MGHFHEISALLHDLNAGKPGALTELVESVYDQVRGIARRRMRRQFGRTEGLTLQPTAVANEVILDLIKQRNAFVNSDQFFALATRLTMRILIDYQRRRLADKRGGGRKRQGIEAADEVTQQTAGLPSDAAADSPAGGVLAAVQRLHELDSRKAEVVTLHVLCEMPLPKVAELVGVSLPTVERDWRFSKAWLAKELGRDQDAGSAPPKAPA